MLAEKIISSRISGPGSTKVSRSVITGIPQISSACKLLMIARRALYVCIKKKYIDKIAKRYGINEETDERDIHSPIASTSKILPSETGDKRADLHEFRSIIGALRFCAHACGPEISAPVTILPRHMIDPSIQHLKQAHRILSYLHKTKRLGLTFQRDHTTTITPEISLPPGTLTGFADAMHVGR